MELLFTLPVPTISAVFGKFFAAWTFLIISLLLTFPMVFTVAYLGDPDWGIIFTSYLGSMLMAGAYLAICSLTSALTKNQVVSFVISFLICLFLVLLGWSVISGFMLTTLNLPVWMVDALSNFSFVTHFDSMMRGLIELKSVVFFVSLAAFALCLNVLALES